MRIAIMGRAASAAISARGCVKGGADVTFIARGAHLAAMRERRTHIESAQSRIHAAQGQRDRRSRDASARSTWCCSPSSCGTPKAPRARSCRSWAAYRRPLASERRAQGRHTAADIRRGRRDGRRRLRRHAHLAARRDRADRRDAADRLRRIRRPALARARGAAGGLHRRAASTRSSATTSAARSGKNTSSWSASPAPRPAMR